MDIHCGHCGEPWEHDTLHDVEGKTYRQAAKLFIQYGCGAFDLDRDPAPCEHEPIYSPKMMEMIRIGHTLSPYPEEWVGPDEIVFMVDMAEDMF